MIDVHSPATRFDLADVAARITMPQMAAIVHQRDAGHSWAATSSTGRVIAVLGLYPLDVKRAELWALFSPPAASSMTALVRWARLTLPRSGYKEIISHARTPQGARLLKLTGFSPVNVTEYKTGVWKWVGS